jgi:hypothetical protein
MIFFSGFYSILLHFSQYEYTSPEIKIVCEAAWLYKRYLHPFPQQ